MEKFTYAPYHEVSAVVPADRNSWVILSKEPVKTAVVFVHGFNGDARETWKGFERAPERPAFRNTDLYFFGYDGRGSNTLAAASFLFQFLDLLGNKPHELLGTLLSPEGRQYRVNGYARTILVAHSLGAVVSRWALVRAAEENAEWRSKLKLVLFAPAHCGSDLAVLAKESFDFAWMKALLGGVKAALPLVRELQSDSRLLEDLESRTKQMLPDHPHLRATKVIIAEHEVVVNNWLFANDPFPIALRRTDHVNICKPTQVLPEPLRLVEDELA
jgi:pimeloyl-ACP methyl ester carboxylesterase